MITIKANVQNDKIELLDKKSIQEYQINIAKIVFSFDESWENYTKYVMFEDSEQKIKKSIIDNVCIIPQELKSGFVKIQVYGEKIEDDKIIQRNPTNVVSFYLFKSIEPTNTNSEEYPEASDLDIILDKIQKLDGKTTTGTIMTQ